MPFCCSLSRLSAVVQGQIEKKPCMPLTKAALVVTALLAVLIAAGASAYCAGQGMAAIAVFSAAGGIVLGGLATFIILRCKQQRQISRLTQQKTANSIPVAPTVDIQPGKRQESKASVYQDCISTSFGNMWVPFMGRGQNSPVNRLELNTGKIFGKGQDFTTGAASISDTQAQKIVEAIRQAAEETLKELEAKEKRGEKVHSFGIYLAIKQVDCYFSAAYIAPLLPHLQNIPNLVGLELGPFGTGKQRMAPREERVGFSDQDTDLLLAVIRNNPHLISVELDTSKMIFDKREEFLKQWDRIQTERMRNWAQHNIPLAFDGNKQHLK